MVTVAEAIKRLEKKYPERRILSGMDMGDFYAFKMMPRSVNPRNVFEIPIEPTMNAIRKKSGEEFLFHAYASDEGSFRGEVDVPAHISDEDAEFARRFKAMLEDFGGDD